MHHSATPFLFWGMLPLSPSFSDIYTTSACLKLPSIFYSPLHGIFSIHTFHTLHIILLPPLYTTPALTGMPHLECSLYSAPVLFVIGYVPDSSSTLFAVPFVVWPHMPPLLPLVASFLLSKEDTLHLCPFSPHLKHSTFTVFCFLIILSFTSHCITLLDNTSNLFWGAVPLFSFPFLFLQFWARCPNPLQLQYSYSFFPSNFALNEVRAHFCLSKLLINESYCYKDMVLYLCRGTEVMLILANYNYVCWGARSSPSQIPTALLTTALIIELNYHLKERIPTLDSLLEVTVTSLHVSLTIECSTRFLTKKTVTNSTTQLQGQV